ncbi:5-oxoprolinase subunit PxpA [Agaribacterium sp. ZY112]|uniref:5-oxoprolinase subunit PxpA n=1 Tax=Agaribacterium sp. ZY112 TaxID=3233574 RepID=UPI003524AB6E
MLLNCDLGEGLSDVDRRIMPFIDQANIACGGNAGDSKSMQETLELALQHDVAIGAHPSYPDKANFGRKSLCISLPELETSLRTQLDGLYELLQKRDLSIEHIKAHGALYNDSNKNEELLTLLIELAKDYNCSLMLQSLPINDKAEIIANKFSVPLIFEAFADRAYDKSGLLVARNIEGAVHQDIDHIVQQALCFAHHKAVPVVNGQALKLHADSLCIHGDSPLALQAISAIYDALR